MGDRLLRLYVSHLPEAGTLELGADAARHARVVRLAPGATLELFDGRGKIARAHLLSVEQQSLSCAVETVEVAPRPERRLGLLLGLTKGAKPDLVVRMATELGVASIRLVKCEHSVVQAQSRTNRLERLQLIAREACAQANRAYLPDVEGPVSLPEVLQNATTRASPQCAYLLLHPTADRALPPIAPSVEEVWALVGPEGGFSKQELASLAAAGFVAASMGPTILRAETAAVAAAARLMERLSGLDTSSTNVRT